MECVARGYLTGSGLLDYRATGAVCGIALPAGLVEASRLPEPIFTPATKADLGEHDENVTFDAVVATVGGRARRAAPGADAAAVLRAPSSTRRPAACCWPTPRSSSALRGDAMVLGDEVLTPDSSRFWPADGYRAGSRRSRHSTSSSSGTG